MWQKSLVPASAFRYRDASPASLDLSSFQICQSRKNVLKELTSTAAKEAQVRLLIQSLYVRKGSRHQHGMPDITEVPLKEMCRYLLLRAFGNI